MCSPCPRSILFTMCPVRTGTRYGDAPLKHRLESHYTAKLIARRSRNYHMRTLDLPQLVVIGKGLIRRPDQISDQCCRIARIAIRSQWKPYLQRSTSGHEDRSGRGRSGYGSRDVDHVLGADVGRVLDADTDAIALRQCNRGLVDGARAIDEYRCFVARSLDSSSFWRLRGSGQQDVQQRPDGPHEHSDA